MKKIFKQLCIIVVYGMVCSCVTSCKQITFEFSLQCSDDLLDFVNPIVTYVDKKDNLQSISLNKSDFSVISTTTIVTVINDSEPIKVEQKKYNWKKQIVLKTESACRSMKVSYKLRDDAPIIDDSKTYIMYHVLTSKHTVINGTYSENINIDIDLGVGTTNKVIGKDLKKYLDDLQSNPDYVEEKSL